MEGPLTPSMRCCSSCHLGAYPRPIKGTLCRLCHPFNAGDARFVVYLSETLCACAPEIRHQTNDFGWEDVMCSATSPSSWWRSRGDASLKDTVYTTVPLVITIMIPLTVATATSGTPMRRDPEELNNLFMAVPGRPNAV